MTIIQMVWSIIKSRATNTGIFDLWMHSYWFIEVNISVSIQLVVKLIN